GVSDTPAAAPTEAPQTSVDPLDQLLAEWDQKYPPQPEVQPSESTPPDDGLAALDGAQRAIDWQEREAQWQTQLQQSSDQLRLLQAQAASANVANEAQINQLKGTVGQLQQSIQQAEWRQHQDRSQQDFQRLVADEQQKLAGLDVDDKFAETFLLAEASRDPQLAKAWEGQYFNGYSPLERAELEMAIFQHGQSLMAKVPLIADASQHAVRHDQDAGAAEWPSASSHAAPVYSPADRSDQRDPCPSCRVWPCCSGRTPWYGTTAQCRRRCR